MKCLLMILLFTTTTGCQLADFTAQAIDDKKKYNDVQASVYVQVPCDMTVGAYWRILTDAQREGVRLFCDPNASVPQ